MRAISALRLSMWTNRSSYVRFQLNSFLGYNRFFSRTSSKSRFRYRPQKKNRTKVRGPRGMEAPLLKGLSSKQIYNATRVISDSTTINDRGVRTGGWGNIVKKKTSTTQQKSLNKGENTIGDIPCIIGTQGIDAIRIRATPTQEKRTHTLFSKPGSFVGSTKDLSDCDELNIQGAPEIAFAGRSNVGKSTLLNALMGTNIVKTSKVAGKTKGVNFFEVGQTPGSIDNLMMVDMPGYGHAKGNKKTKQELAGRIFAYALHRGARHVRKIFLLIDSRRGPMATDKLMMTQMDKRGVNFHVVLTKCDTISRNELSIMIQKVLEVTEDSVACDPFFHIVSSKKGTFSKLIFLPTFFFVPNFVLNDFF
eukprot:GSMAST32.ASY1.ANO1.2314.1 assembled CDS